LAAANVTILNTTTQCNPPLTNHVTPAFLLLRVLHAQNLRAAAAKPAYEVVAAVCAFGNLCGLLLRLSLPLSSLLSPLPYCWWSRL